MPESESGLRARLVQVGIEILESRGQDALTLREIARRAGVSHGAPRRYFPTHRELLSAIAREGFAEMARQFQAVLAAEDDERPRAQLLALGLRYLEFARANAGMFQLMYRHDLLESNHLGLRESSLPLFAALVGLIGRARAGTSPPAEIVAGGLWANFFGLAQLHGWGSLQLATGTDDVEPLVRAALDAYLGPASPADPEGTTTP